MKMARKGLLPPFPVIPAYFLEIALR